jgi:hypothetical protein
VSGAPGLFWDFGQKKATFAIPLPNSIRVVRKILDLYVLVRIQVGQQFYVHALKPALAAGFGVQYGWRQFSANSQVIYSHGLTGSNPE